MDRQVAIITGAGRGIGQACAVEISAAGFSLVLAARSSEELQKTRSLVDDGLCIPTDVTQIDQIEALAHRTLKLFGRIDALINNAGMAPSLSVEQTTPDQWRQIIDTNLSSAFHLCRAVWPAMKSQKAGVIVNISSFAARDPFPGFAAYGAAKAGLNTLSLALAREGRPHGIRVHTVAPGAVETSMFRSLIPEDQWPREKTLDPADVAKVVVRCITGELQYTSGEVIYLSK